MNFKHPHIGLIAILAFGVTLFVVSTVMVVAQGFLEPSGAAPQSNVVDFLVETSVSQARSGKIRIGSNVIPKDVTDPVFDVVGNAYLQGDVSFDQNGANDISLFVNNGGGKSYVGTGTVNENGKYSANATTGIALTGSSNSKYGIDVTTLAGGSTAYPKSVVYGETIQSGSIGVSAGVWGHATGNGAGVFGENINCPGADVTACGYAGKFIGNVIVANGVLKGDARDVYRAWSVRDATITSGGTGIGFKTFDFPSTKYGDFDNSDPKTVQVNNALGVDANFISLSVLVDGLPYDPRRAALATTDANYLSVTFEITDPADPSSIINRLIVKKSTSSLVTSVTVHVFFHQKVTAVITESGTVLAFKNVLIGSGTQYALSAQLAGGKLGTTDFNWGLYKDATATTACVGSAGCGQIMSGFETGPTTAYVPPSDNIAVANTVPNRVVYLKATWTADPTVAAILPIPLYYLEMTTAASAMKIGYGFETAPGVFTNPYTFAADVIPPGAAPVPSINWTVVPGTETGSINSSSGAYTVPAIKTSGSAWTETIEASISVAGSTFTKQHTFDLVPHVLISAITPASQQIGTGQTVVLEGVAQNIPIAQRHNLVWTLEAGSLAGEAINPVVTSNTLQTSTYTAPTNLSSDRVRTVTAKWYKNNDQTQTIAASNGTFNAYPGTFVGPSISRTVNSTGTHSMGMQGFMTDRKMYAICTNVTCSTETVINYAGTFPQAIGGTTCGSLSVAAAPPADSCNLDVSNCILNTSFTYSSAGSACTQTLYVKASADQREISPFTITSTGSTGCTCVKGWEPCCVGGDTGGTGF